MNDLFYAFPEIRRAYESAQKRRDGVFAIEHVYLTFEAIPQYRKLFREFGYNREKFEEQIEETLCDKSKKHQDSKNDPIIEDAVKEFFSAVEKLASTLTAENREHEIFKALFQANPPLAIDLLDLEDTTISETLFLSNEDIYGEDNEADEDETLQGLASRAREIAGEIGSSEIQEVHFWMAMLENVYLNPVFITAGIPREETIEKLKAFAKEDIQPSSLQEGDDDQEPVMSEDMHQILLNAVARHQEDGLTPTVYDFLSLVYRPENSPTNISSAFKEYGLEPEIVRDFIGSRQPDPIQSKLDSNVTVRFLTDQSGHLTKQQRYERIRLAADLAAKETIGTYGRNLTLEATDAERQEVIGCDDQVDELIRILCLSEKPNGLIHGQPGVGKTVLGKALAARIADGNVPPALQDRMVFLFESNDMMAGTRYRGDLEERVKGIVDNAKKSRAILFLDEFHNFTGGQYDISEMLKPALADGSISVIGTTTTKTLQRLKTKDPALLRRFTFLEKEASSPEDAVRILDQGYVVKFAKHYGLEIEDEAVVEAVRLAHLYVHNKQLPESAIDVLDRACSNVHCSFSLQPRQKRVKAEHMNEALKSVAPGLAAVLGEEFTRVALALPDELPKRVFEQPVAIEALSNAIATAAAGLSDLDKPFGNFLFTGPSGVGKTELTKALAELSGRPLVRFDMSEYMERHAVSRLIGAPPGYVGYDQGGLLTDAIDKQPYSILLLDEIEKAHPDIFKILLQVMDRGRLTSSEGLEVDFTKTMIIMTSNCGNDQVEKEPIGFGAERAKPAEAFVGAAKKMFSPEFLGRLGESNIIPFSHLGKKAAPMVVGKFLKKIEEMVQQRDKNIEFSQACRDALEEKGVSRTYGARNLEGLIKGEIINPLSRKLLQGDLGTKIRVDFKDNAFVIEAAPQLPDIVRSNVVAFHENRDGLNRYLN